MGAKRRPIAPTAVAILLALSFARDGIAQSTPAAAQNNASIDSYLPDFRRLQQQGDMAGLAQALRQASLAILDDHSISAADPSAWAPFTLVGEAGR
jgi:hypothetical protein